MAEVEDEAGLFACLIQHTLRFDPSNLRGRRQYDGVEITLDRGAVVKCAAHAAQIHSPVEAEDRGASMDLIGGFVPHPFCIEDYRYAFFELLNNVANPAQRPRFVMRSWANCAP